MLSSLRHRLRTWINRPAGRSALAFVLIALISAGIPTGIVHSHERGDSDHHHASMSLLEFGTVADHTGQPDPDGGAMVHVHAPVSTVSMLVAAAADPDLRAPVVRQLTVDTSSSLPASTTHRPLYRPPIA